MLVLLLAVVGVLAIVLILLGEPYTWMLLGFASIVLSQVVLFMCYFSYKFKSFYGGSRISVRLNPYKAEDQRATLRFNTLRSKVIFLNKYSQQAKLARKKMKFAQKKFEEGQEPEQQIQPPKVNYFKGTNEFLSSIELYQSILDRFSRCPVTLGQSLASLGRVPLLVGQQPRFIFLQQSMPSYLPLAQLTDSQKSLLTSLDPNPDPLQLQHSILFLPSWQSFKQFLNGLGSSLEKCMGEIRYSNMSLVSITHKKILEDQEFLTSEIRILENSIQETKEVLDRLQDEEAKNVQTEQDETAENQRGHARWVHWLKRRYKEFTNLTLQIRQNQTKLKYQKQKLRYYKQNLQTFLTKYKHTFYKSQKTSFRAYFQGYNNAASDSLDLFKLLMRANHHYVDTRPPRVRQMIIATTLQQILLAEKKYRFEYFQRADFFLSEAKLMELALEDLSRFMGELNNIFVEFRKENERNMQTFEKYQTKFYLKFFENVTSSLVSEKFLEELEALIKVNAKFYESNKHQLLVMQGRIVRLKQSVDIQIKNLENMQNINWGDLDGRELQIRSRLQQNYRIIEQQVQLVLKFKQLYLIHSNRIKKSLLLSVNTMLLARKRTLSDHIQKIDSKLFAVHNTTELNLSMTGEQMNFDQDAEESKSEDSEEQPDNVRDIQMSSMFVDCLNKFLFAACLEWGTSQCFKNNIQKKLYIMFNSETTERLSEVEVNNINLVGPPMRIQSFRGLRSEDLEALIELEISFPGYLSLEINTNFKIFQSMIPIRAKAEIRGLNCTARICFVPSKIGRGWFSFIGEPILKIDIVPVFGNFSMDYQTVRKFIENFLLDKLKRKIFPIKAPIRVPMSKKSKKGKIVKQRMRQMAQMARLQAV